MLQPGTEQRCPGWAFNRSPRFVIHLHCENLKYPAEVPVPNPRIGSAAGKPSPPTHPSQASAALRPSFAFGERSGGPLHFARRPEAARRCWRGRQGARVQGWTMTPPSPFCSSMSEEAPGCSPPPAAPVRSPKPAKQLREHAGEAWQRVGARSGAARVRSRQRQDPALPGCSAAARRQSLPAERVHHGGNRGFPQPRRRRASLAPPPARTAMV